LHNAVLHNELINREAELARLDALQRAADGGLAVVLRHKLVRTLFVPTRNGLIEWTTSLSSRSTTWAVSLGARPRAELAGC
jgi:hypothetical protein